MQFPPADATSTTTATSALVMASHSKDRISYYYAPGVGEYHYGEKHPMKPPRLALTHNLILAYGLARKMDVFKPRRAEDVEITEFHAEDYVEFLKRVTPDNVNNFQKFLTRFNVGVEDCPVFDGMYDFCRLYSGGSIAAARKLVTEKTDIAINWSGGLHHAKKFEASGFCYINDIVLAILELLRFYPRVLYVDIDVHHGDGVQEAFYQTDRVMTVSFHRYDGMFFPGTGSLDEIGSKTGKYYSINVPLQEHIDDDAYFYIFKHVMQNVMDSYRPSAVVLQCGADSLASDRLGCFNLSIKGHGNCVKFMKGFKVPLIVLGGGGYTIRNVSRCWTYETGILTDTELPNEIPKTTDYYSHYAPDHKLHPPIVDHHANNNNTRHYLDAIKTQVAEYLRNLNNAPSVQMSEIPPGVNCYNDTGEWPADRIEDTQPDLRINDSSNRDLTMDDIANANASRRNKEVVEFDEREYYGHSADQDHDGVDIMTT
ncbi:hypothetical protein SeMB42_g00223 [Synchytrium endobioticum]|uniref:Histone deacetylase n=1 Tax=Synchytrium endobioticum TaxID=286115 RepID=A0A507DUD4_9FUNG|nr:hypothetical protein SeLEV6574_g07932 [Synchytrium endobioticum]TPX54548.1 hypothetical protein SeMB42_g00223 [Synchytrium endobioticum]